MKDIVIYTTPTCGYCKRAMKHMRQKKGAFTEKDSSANARHKSEFRAIGGRGVPISTRDARTKVMVRDGGTTVLGGIYKMQEGDSTNGVPYLNKIPIVGWLFKNTEVSTQHDELLIFITPRIIKY